MLAAPRHDWALCERRSRLEHIDWLRRLTPADVLDLHEDFYSLLASHTCPDCGLGKISKDHWAEKVALRRKLRSAFLALDQTDRRE
jgi:hypothetical protein